MATRGRKSVCDRVLNHPKYTEYIRIHLEDLQSKCDTLTTCINKLVSQQSPIAVLSGKNLGLNKICELINVKENSTAPVLDGKCSHRERVDIMTDVENHIRDKMQKRNNWDDVAVCLENNYGDKERTTYVGDLCGIVERKGEICNYDNHLQVERFVNEQIEHLQCTCRSLQTTNDEEHDHSLSTAALIGIIAGAVLFLCILFGLIFCCWRKKHRKRKKKAPNVIYLPAANADNYPVYQEVFDQRDAPPNPPMLPSRYGSRPLPCHPIDDTEYLEPVQAQAAVGSYRSKAPSKLPGLVNNPGYNVDDPPEYSETDQMYEDPVLITPGEVNVYIDPIVTPIDNRAGGYDSLDVRNDDERRGDNSDQTDQYQPLEDIDTDRKLGPAPAERTKKENRETESEYFELEKESTTV